MGKGLDKFLKAKKALHDGMVAAGTEYAVRRADGSKPIVDQHYTAGNDARQGWPPLSREYFLAKQRGIVSRGGGSHIGLDATERQFLSPAHRKELAKSRPGSKLDHNAQFRSSTGQLTGTGSGKNLPMLVFTGTLRRAVTAGGAEVTADISTGLIRIRFRGLPDYAVYLDQGTGKMPARSPVRPNQTTDRQQVIDALRRFIERATGKGGAVPVSGNTVPGKARVL